MRTIIFSVLFPIVLLAGCGGNSSSPLPSPNGVSWTNRASGTTNKLNSVAYGGGLFVAVGGLPNFSVPVSGGNSSSSVSILTSPDGVNWTSQPPITTFGLFGVIYGNGRFVAVGAMDILTSPDGIAWT